MIWKEILKRLLVASNMVRYWFARSRFAFAAVVPSQLRRRNHGNAVLQFNAIRSMGGAAQVALSIHREMLKRSRISGYLFEHFDQDPLEEAETVVAKQSSLYRSLAKVDRLTGFQKLTIGNASQSIKRAATAINAGVLHLHNLHGSSLTPLVLPWLARRYGIVWTLHDMQAITGHCAHSYECVKWAKHCGNCPHLDVYPSMLIDRTREMLKLKKAAYSLSRAIIVSPSAWLKQKIERSILGRHRIELIYNGIDMEFFHLVSSTAERDAIRRSFGIPVNRTVVLFAAAGGSGNAWKGGEYVERFRSSNGNSFMFVEIGGKKETRSHFDMSIGYVRSREELRKLYQASDLLLYPSLADNCPLVVLEAQACGCAVAAFSTGGIPELVENGFSGLIAGYRDYKELVSKIQSLLRRPDRIARMGRSARLFVAARFSFNRMVDRYISIYDELLG